MDARTLADRLDDLLDTDAYADLDASPNGLQVGPGDREVESVALAVDAAVATAERAREAGADLLLAHHGVVWGDVERVTGQAYRRLEPLFAEGMPLYVSHLPLDGHQELGNAAGLADLLDLGDREPFGALGPEVVGQRGRLPEPTPLETLVERLAEDLDTGGRPVQTLDFGPERVTEVAIVTGSGADWLAAAADAGADVLVTGEGKQQVYHEARETGTNVVLAGHYATETFGVRAVGERLREWGLETTFIECPTGL
jgi:dinuclear metal center YbgI/SA1388 family protein